MEPLNPEDIYLDGDIIYSPKGPAREYALVGSNFYVGCSLQCDYCYNRKGIFSAYLGKPEVSLKKGKKVKITSESTALKTFCTELQQSKEYLQQTGLFFSFTTDPMLPETRNLTWMATGYALENDVPVRILTKVSDFGTIDTRLEYVQKYKHLLSFGFTLTGTDDQEPGAQAKGYTNDARIAKMALLKEKGFNTFASVEPVVDVEASLEMIEKSLGFCDMYMIGLLSKHGKGYYNPTAIRLFYKVLKSYSKQYGIRLFLKESFRTELLKAGLNMNKDIGTSFLEYPEYQP